MKFNFDEWAQLAKQDEAAFEEKRAIILKQEIENCASNDRELRILKGLQFRIDMIRRKHKTPLAACMAISKMLMDQVYQLENLDIAAIIQNSATEAGQNTDTCKIIPFDTLRK
jgi:hypothetical protein